MLIACFVKNQLFEVPPLFKTIQLASNTSWHEMYKTFNMGHHLELYINAQPTVDVINLAKAFNIETKIIGFASEQNEIAFSLRIGSKKTFYEAETLNFLDRD